MTQKRNRLNGQDWLRAGLDALADEGPAALNASRLARRLGVTTGSFYWHFQSLDAFRLEVLEFWKEEVLLRGIREARARAQDPKDVFAKLQELILEFGWHRYDAATRNWAAVDPSVRDSVREADAIRENFLYETLRDAGHSEEEARARTDVARFAWRGSHEQAELEHRMKQIRVVISS